MNEDHSAKVEWLKGLCRNLHLPVLPPHIVSCESYHPDACTRIKEHFVVFEYINSEGQFNFDIGGLALLLMHKDIIDCCVAVVGRHIYPDLMERIKRFRSPFLDRLVVLSEDEIQEWLEKQIALCGLWRLESLKIKR